VNTRGQPSHFERGYRRGIGRGYKVSLETGCLYLRRQVRLLAQSGHAGRRQPRPLSGVKRTRIMGPGSVENPWSGPKRVCKPLNLHGAPYSPPRAGRTFLDDVLLLA